MGKMNNLSLELEELRKNTNKLSEILSTVSEIITTINDIVGTIESAFSSSPETPKEDKKSVTLEEVRAVLAEKSREGKTAEVKGLLTKFFYYYVKLYSSKTPNLTFLFRKHLLLLCDFSLGP